MLRVTFIGVGSKVFACHRYVLEKHANDKDGSEQNTSQILAPPSMQEQENV
jgi:hypothetical protein